MTNSNVFFSNENKFQDHISRGMLTFLKLLKRKTFENYGGFLNLDAYANLLNHDE